jgi:flagellar basal-body rod modification protein FlgD
MSPIDSTSSNPRPHATSSSPPQSASVSDPLANESTFLTLLVSQLQNQDPLNPTDSNQFISQLTAYSQLEQLIGIHKNTTPVTPADTDPASTPAAQAQAAIPAIVSPAIRTVEATGSGLLSSGVGAGITSGVSTAAKVVGSLL